MIVYAVTWVPRDQDDLGTDVWVFRRGEDALGTAQRLAADWNLSGSEPKWPERPSDIGADGFVVARWDDFNAAEPEPENYAVVITAFVV